MYPSKRQEMGNPSCQKQLPLRDRKHSTHQNGDDLRDGFLIASISVILNSPQYKMSQVSVNLQVNHGLCGVFDIAGMGLPSSKPT